MKPSKLSKPKLPPRLTFEAIGTDWYIEWLDNFSQHVLDNAEKQIENLIANFDATYSRFRDDSLISQIAKQAGTYRMPDNAAALFNTFYEMYQRSNGAFTPLIGQTIDDAGYDATYGLQARRTLRKAPKWEDCLQYKHPYLEVLQPVLLDFGGGGKGYLVDLVAELLIKNNVERFCINAGGDMYYHNPGGSALPVALENPNNTSEAIGVAYLAHSKSLCGSAGNRRKWGDYHHIIDPRTNVSPKTIAAVWVIASSGLQADCLSTALFVTPPKVGDQFVIMKSDQRLQFSKQFPAEFFGE